MHSLSSVYFVSHPLHVSGIFVVHHQEVYCIYIQQLAHFVLFNWLSVGLVEMEGNQANRHSTENLNTYQLLYICSVTPDDGLQICSKYIEVNWRYKLRIKSPSSWFLLHRCIEMYRDVSRCCTVNKTWKKSSFWWCCKVFATEF